LIDLGENPGFAQLPTGEIIPVSVGPYDLSFIGTKLDGSTVTNTFTITNFLILDTFTFSGFTDLVSVSWSGQATQFDNIVVTSAPVCSSTITTIDGLRAEVDALNTSIRTINTLNRVVNKVQMALDNGKNKAARHKMEEFIEHLVNRSNLPETNRTRVPLDEANDLICDAANVLIGIPLP